MSIYPLGVLALAATVSLSGSAVARSGTPEPRTVHVFYDNVIHYTPGDSGKYDTPLVRGEDAGRVLRRTLDLAPLASPVRITAHVATRPIPIDDENVQDKWDRAGNVRLRRPGMADIEIVKFVTAYGGETVHDVDVSYLAPLLAGGSTFVGFVDTWSSPGWKMDFSLLFEPVSEDPAPDWVEGTLYEENVTAASPGADGTMVAVDIPRDTRRVVMHYLASGHATDGRGADEFESRDHVITIDGREVIRFRPWRDDCRDLRAVNPYCRRWSDGSWSADYSRSGWCPGDKVLPREIDMSPYLSPGPHTIRFQVEGIRPRDEGGHQGYWRLSSRLLGWRD
jgi:hypothetical protein